MFKKLYLLSVILFFWTLETKASFWSDLKECLSNPCNCGGDTRYEDWNGERLNKGDENALCPPWNKTSGRDNHTCLANTAYPRIFIPWHLVHCAESTPESTYFTPKIRIRYQSCNIACWTLTKTLNWNGQCLVWPTPYAFPLLRICARLAMPADPIRQTPQDPGYTKGKHLNYEGFEEDDRVIIGSDGQPIVFDPPKLCAYRDPSVFDTVAGFSLDGWDFPDLMDFNPVKQPIHKTSEVHPIIKVIIFLFEMVSETAQSITDMLGSLFDMLGGAIIPNFNFFKPVFDVLGAIIGKFAEAIIALLEEVGQINRVVSDYKFGCVEVPMGPFPPPFCKKILPFIPTPATQNICKTGSTGVPVSSTSEEPCVVSKLTNNFIRNSIRVTFDNFIPICKKGEDPTKTDKCVTFSNMGLFNSASGFHIASARRDAIKRCADVSGSAPCVNTKIPHQCSITSNGCEDGFRVVYASKIGTTSLPSNYFFDDLSDCGSASAGLSCQEIWGINTGEFADVSILFPAIQTSGDTVDLIQTLTLKDTNQTEHDFNISIVRNSYFDSVTQLQREPNQICAFESDIVVGCEAREEASRPKVYDCSSGMAGLSCINSYFTPRFIVSLKSKDGIDSTNAVVEPLSVYNATSTDFNINLAGYAYSSFVTDESFIEKPFAGPNSFNSSSVYGEYIDRAKPYDSDFNPNNDAVYLSGLEYVNDKYIQGGKYACLKIINIEHCPLNVKNCVLSNLLNSNIVNCNDFLTKANLYPNLRYCDNPRDSSCKSKDSIPAKSGGFGVTIYECGPEDNYTYCYENFSKVEVCKISTNPEDRAAPSSSLGTELSDDQYYDPSVVPASSSPNEHTYKSSYDSSLYGLRDKTSIEFGLCLSIPQPVCAETVEGNATWPETNIGEISTGACLPGYVAKIKPKSLKRYCVANAQTKTVNFEPVDADTGCVEIGK